MVNLPVASGKSLLAQAIAKWAGPAITLVPNNILLDQYLKDYPTLHVLRGKKHYWCTTLKMSLEARGSLKPTLCPIEIHCWGCNQYRWVLKRNWTASRMLSNYHTYLAHRLHRRYSTVIIDEAHNLIPVLQEMGQVKIWRHQLPPESQYPLSISTTRELIEWLDSLPPSLLTGKKGKLFTKFLDCVDNPRYLFKAGEEEYRGEERHCLKLIPLDIRDEPALFFPPGVKKIVLMSATISPTDIEQLGLYTRRVKYLTAASPIPASQRPVVVPVDALDMSYHHQKTNLPRLVESIKNILRQHPGDKGLIHAPYSLAKKLREALQGEKRMLFHTKENKKLIYQEFRSSLDPVVLVASGMYEGVDLPAEAGRFQIITKIPFPSLAEPAIAHRASVDKNWYQWETIKILQQAVGRICRGPEDWGVTIILDSSFKRLYRSSSPDFWPAWWIEALLLEGEQS